MQWKVRQIYALDAFRCLETGPSRSSNHCRSLLCAVALPSVYTPESVEKLEEAAAGLAGLATGLSAYNSDQLRADLQELQEELEIGKDIAEERRLEEGILTETKSLLVLQARRHAAELPRA